jgi:hypothetical protein
MKHGLYKLFFILFVAFCANCLADCNCPEGGVRFIPCPKTYVKPNQIDFHENAIFVQINDMIIQTESLNTDVEGIFFVNVSERDCGFAQWKCNKKVGPGLYCNACNWPWDNRCYLCRNKR